MRFAFFLTGALLAAAAANAGPAADLTSPGDPFLASPYTLGFIFTLGGNATATKLGIYDWNGDGLETDAQVGLWTDTGTLLASVTVGAGTSGQLIGAYRYVNITPVSLLSGSSYVVGSYMNSDARGTASSFGTGEGGTGSFDSLITFASDRYTNLSYDFSFPDQGNGNTGGAWAGGNVFLSSPGGVPEPASWAMLVAGFGLVGGTLRRRQAAPARPIASA